MKMLLLIVSMLLGSVLGFGQGSTYILRYQRSEPIAEFLANRGMFLRKSVPMQPIYLAEDTLGRTVSQALAALTSDDVSAEPNLAVRLPEAGLSRPLNSDLRQLQSALSDRTMSTYWGAPVPRAYPRQLAARQVKADISRSLHGAGTGIVAFIDTGIDPQHPFLTGRVMAGFDFTRDSLGASEWNDLSLTQRAIVNPTTTPLLRTELFRVNPTTTPLLERQTFEAMQLAGFPETFGHGTMVAGAIRLVAPSARLLPIKSFGADGTGTLFNVVQGIYYAQRQGAKVLNLSLNFYGRSRSLEDALEFVSQQGVICVASAGNDGLLTADSFPAAHPRVTGVASVSPTLVRSLFSNHGESLVWVAAPGEGLLLPYPGGRWSGAWGTSFAAPLVSGMASVLTMYKRDATYSDLQSALSKSAPLSSTTLGLGLLDVPASVGAFR